MPYANLDLDAFDYSRNDEGESFRVFVSRSPVGAQRPSEAELVRVSPDLRRQLRQLEGRKLRLPELIALGEELAAMLLPPAAREFLTRSLSGREEERVRIRIRVDAVALSDIPWEYVYIAPPGTPEAQKNTTGFLALNPRISIVRFEVLKQAEGTLEPVGSSPLRMVTLLANPADEGGGSFPPLDLDAERANIQKALAKVTDVRCEFYPDATIDTLEEALEAGAHLFHFAGHGVFETEFGAQGGDGRGYIVLVDEAGAPVRFPADRLALNLKGRGVRLATLGACEVARRDQVNAWTGVVPALTEAGIPAVLGMQYSVRDTNAIAFSHRFYRALARSQPIDAAVTDGRQAIANRNGDDERDWGVPVLYLRADDGVLFPPSDPVQTGNSWLDVQKRTSDQIQRVLREARGSREHPGTYIPEVYVERGSVEKELWALLDGEERAQIVVGDSGVGLTNLLCRWTEEVTAAGHAVLLYDCGGALPLGLEEEIARDLSLSDPASLLTTLEQLDELTGKGDRQLVLVFDALNEYRAANGSGPRELLLRINELVGRLRGGSVRVVVGCSLATWNRLDRSDVTRQLSWSRYRRSGGATRPLHLDEFTAEELETAYARYAEFFRLAAPFSEVKPALRERLRRPLLLRMLAEAQSAQPRFVPSDSLVLEIYQRYYDERVRRRRDILFMEELATEMLRQERGALPINSFPRGGRLSEEMESDDTDSSFCLLQDKGVITEVSGSIFEPDTIRFTYVQVGAYTLARHLLQRPGPRDETLAELVRQSPTFPLAWDAARILLLLCRDQELLARLASSGDVEVRELVSETLVEMYADEPGTATEWIRLLLQSDSAEARRTALKAAYYIGAGARELFIWAVVNGTPELRQATNDTLYLLWRQGSRQRRDDAAETLYLIWRVHPDFTYAFLRDLADQIKLSRPRELRRIVEFIVQLSVTIYINHCDQPEVVEETSRLYATLAKDRLHLHRFNTGVLGQGLEKLIFRAVAAAFSEPILKTILFTELVPAEHFFNLPAADRACLVRVASLLDPQSDPRPHRDDLKAMLESETMFFNVAAAVVLGVHACRNFPAVGAWLEDLHQELDARGRLWLLLSFSVLLRQTPPGWVPLLERLTSRLIAEHPEMLDGEGQRILGSVDLVFVPLGLAYGKAGGSMPLFERLIQEALAARDEPRLARLLAALGPVGFFYPQAVFGTLRAAISSFDDPRLLEALLSPLALVRTLFLDEVDQFLQEIGAGEAFQHRVAAEADVALLQRYITWLGFYNNAVHFSMEYPRMRNAFSMRAFTLLATAQTPNEFVVDYTTTAVRMFREADFQLRNWTLP